MREIIVAVLLLALGAGPALAQKSDASDGNADVLNAPIAKAGDGSEIAATAPPVAPAPAAAPAATPVPSRITAAAGDGPAAVLNGFVLKEVAQCRPLPADERRACCERLLHPNACVE